MMEYNRQSNTIPESQTHIKSKITEILLVFKKKKKTEILLNELTRKFNFFI